MNIEITHQKLKDLMREVERIEYSTEFDVDIVESAKEVRIKLDNLINNIGWTIP